jgi:hypothetical protein
MHTEDLHSNTNSAPNAAAQQITIHVNERSVVMLGHEQTGLEIKEAAIAQGVPIKLDFVLSIERGQGQDQTKVVGNDDRVQINEHSRFTAVDDDDNS